MTEATTEGTAPKSATPPRRWRVRLLGCATLLLLGGTLAYWCWFLMIYAPGESYEGEMPPLRPSEVSLRDELERDVAHLSLEIGVRSVAAYPQLNQAADWIEEELSAAGYDVQRQEYEVESLACFNLEVEIAGSEAKDEIVVIGAHYDSFGGIDLGTPGANDNGSGAAALLALARRFADAKPQKTLRFVAFTNEEPPYFQTPFMGSVVYARRCKQRDENLVAVLSLETMGYFTDAENSQNYPSPFNHLYPSTGNFIGVVGDVNSRPLVQQVIGSFRRNAEFPSESGALPATVSGIGWSDHWSFWQEGYQAVMITDTALFRYPHYHTPEDTPDKLNFEAMARVVEGLEAVIAELAGIDNAAVENGDVED